MSVSRTLILGLVLALFSCLPVMLTSCATVVSGTMQEVTFRSTPAGATVEVDGRVLGSTPLTVTIKKRPGQELRFTREGYRPLSASLETRTNPWFFGNIMCGGLLGSTTDGVSGAIYEYSPSQYLVTLEPTGTRGLEREASKEKAHKTREYIIIAYNSILSDLAARKGAHLDALLSLLGTEESERDRVVSQIEAYSVLYTDLVDFADRVTETLQED